MTNTLNHSDAGAAILERNSSFAAAEGHVGVGVFPTLRLLVLTCLDPRVDPAHILGLDLGEAMVLRNGGGRVTPDVIANISFVGQLAAKLVEEGPLFEVAVLHHSECGTALLAIDEFRQAFAARVDGYAVVDPKATVARDVDVLRQSEAISPRITISGYVYDVNTGLVESATPSDLELSA